MPVGTVAEFVRGRRLKAARKIGEDPRRAHVHRYADRRAHGPERPRTVPIAEAVVGSEAHAVVPEPGAEPNGPDRKRRAAEDADIVDRFQLVDLQVRRLSALVAKLFPLVPLQLRLNAHAPREATRRAAGFVFEGDASSPSAAVQVDVAEGNRVL